MEKIGIFYGSDTGNTERIAELIAEKIGSDNVDLIDLQSGDLTQIANYKNVILGAPTWYDGELQSDWDDHLDEIEEIDFEGKKVTLFGLGDQFGYSYNFLDALGIIYDKLTQCGATVVGHWDCSDYQYDESKAERDGKFVGLGIDEDNESSKTDERVEGWLKVLNSEFN